MKFPAGYEWLGELGTLPKLTTELLKMYGTEEVLGKKNNPVIMDWADETHLETEYTADSIPWCGLGMAVAVQRTGREYVKNPLWARNWAKWGVMADYAALGDILVYVRDGGGHVNSYICEDHLYYYGIGCNQSDTVNITKILKVRCIAVVRPDYKNRPASAKPYHRTVAGKVSSNEA
jgi:uncharacterized protein (TIGR02594 family)